MRRFIDRLLNCTKGLAAIEFGLLLPVMVLLLSGVVEVTNLMMAQRKLLNATHTIGDLIAQEDSLTSGDLTDIFSAGSLIMSPFSTSTFNVGVTSVNFDSDSTASVGWTSSHNSGSVSNATSLVSGLEEANASVVVVTASYTYTPIVSAILTGNFPLSETVLLRPRATDQITFN